MRKCFYQFNGEGWLEITRVKNIGQGGAPINQKTIRLSPEEQFELFELFSANSRFVDALKIRRMQKSIK